MSEIDHHCIVSDEFKAFAGFYDVDVSARRWYMTEGVVVNEGEGDESDESSLHGGAELKVLPRAAVREAVVVKAKSALCCIAL